LRVALYLCALKVRASNGVFLDIVSILVPTPTLTAIGEHEAVVEELARLRAVYRREKKVEFGGLL